MCSLWCRCSVLCLALNYETENTTGLTSSAAGNTTLYNLRIKAQWYMNDQTKDYWLSKIILHRNLILKTASLRQIIQLCGCLMAQWCTLLPANNRNCNTFQLLMLKVQLSIQKASDKPVTTAVFCMLMNYLVCWIPAIFSQLGPDSTRRCCVGEHFGSYDCNFHPWVGQSDDLAFSTITVKFPTEKSKISLKHEGDNKS